MLLAAQLSTQGTALVAAVLVGAGLALAVVAMIMRVRTKQRTLAQILDDTMGAVGRCRLVGGDGVPRTWRSPRSQSVSPGSSDEFDTHGALERRLERAAIPLRAGEYLVIGSSIVRAGRHCRGAGRLGDRLGRCCRCGCGYRVVSGHRGQVAKRIKQIQEQLPDVLALMSASVRVVRPFSEPSTCIGGTPSLPSRLSLIV